MAALLKLVPLFSATTGVCGYEAGIFQCVCVGGHLCLPQAHPPEPQLSRAGENDAFMLGHLLVDQFLICLIWSLWGG